MSHKMSVCLIARHIKCLCVCHKKYITISTILLKNIISNVYITFVLINPRLDISIYQKHFLYFCSDSSFNAKSSTNNNSHEPVMLSLETCLCLKTTFPGLGLGINNSGIGLVSLGLGVEH